MAILENGRHLGFLSRQSADLFNIPMRITVPNLVLVSQFARFCFKMDFSCSTNKDKHIMGTLFAQLINVFERNLRTLSVLNIEQRNISKIRQLLNLIFNLLKLTAKLIGFNLACYQGSQVLGRGGLNHSFGLV